MADKPEKKPAAKKEAAKKKKKGKLVSSLYVLAGERIQRKNKFCPKCGPGTFMALHKDRVVCGKCKYVEFGRKG